MLKALNIGCDWRQIDSPGQDLQKLTSTVPDFGQGTWFVIAFFRCSSGGRNVCLPGSTLKFPMSWSYRRQLIAMPIYRADRSLYANQVSIVEEEGFWCPARRPWSVFTLHRHSRFDLIVFSSGFLALYHLTMHARWTRRIIGPRMEYCWAPWLINEIWHVF